MAESHKMEFTDDELRLFDVIRKHAESFESPVTPRVAGGFVRDKFMKMSSHDIDICLDTVSGIEFASKLSDAMKMHPNVHTISANPDKSKHLETAVMNIFGFSVDFVHLRSESYAKTRIPEIKAGSPTEDAFRRDITINSLFYNIVSGEIEDFTGRGIRDIQDGLIDTPLDPRITLFDDPLRILRIFRFRSKLGFRISDRIYEALADTKIVDALATKVSRERVYIELSKMVGYAHGETGMLEIVHSGMVNAVFKPPIDIRIDTVLADKFSENLVEIDKILVQQNLQFKLKTKQIDTAILKFYIVLHYFIGAVAMDGTRACFVNCLIMRKSLKACKNIINTVNAIETGIEYITKAQKSSDMATIDPVECVVRLKSHWIEVLMILYCASGEKTYTDLMFTIFDLGYQECYLAAPLIDGNWLQSKGTKIQDMKRMLHGCMVMQIKHPEMVDEEIYQHVLDDISD